MKKLNRAAAVTLLVGLIMGYSAGAASATQEEVTICHRTGSASNPYVQISPSASGVFHGHLDHEQTGNGLGGDIIPPFEYKGKTYSKNWDAEGQAIFANGCKVPGDDKPNPDPDPSDGPTPRDVPPVNDGPEPNEGRDLPKDLAQTGSFSALAAVIGLTFAALGGTLAWFGRKSR